MDEIGIKRRSKLFELLYDSIFDLDVKSIEIVDGHMDNNIKVGTIIDVRNPRNNTEVDIIFDVLGSGQLKWGKMAKEPANKKLNRIKEQGILKRFTDANSAWYGKNWSESRQHTLAERRRLSAGLAELPPEYANNHLAKIIEKHFTLPEDKRLKKSMDVRKAAKKRYTWDQCSQAWENT